MESDETRDFGSTQFTDSDLLPSHASDDDTTSRQDEEIPKERLAAYSKTYHEHGCYGSALLKDPNHRMRPFM